MFSANIHLYTHISPAFIHVHALPLPYHLYTYMLLSSICTHTGAYIHLYTYISSHLFIHVHGPLYLFIYIIFHCIHLYMYMPPASLCTYPCIHLYMYNIHLYMPLHLFIYVHATEPIYIHTCPCIYLYTYVPLCPFIHIHGTASIYTHTCPCTCLYTYVSLYLFIHVHAPELWYLLLALSSFRFHLCSSLWAAFIEMLPSYDPGLQLVHFHNALHACFSIYMIIFYQRLPPCKITPVRTDTTLRIA